MIQNISELNFVNISEGYQYFILDYFLNYFFSPSPPLSPSRSLSLYQLFHYPNMFFYIID